MTGGPTLGVLGDAALAYAGKGWNVLPLRPGAKQPLVPRGLTDASADATVVAGWWRRWPTANVGCVVPPGVVVIDVDPVHGGRASLAALEQRYGGLPRETLVARTGHGGRHVYFSVASGTRVRRSVGSERNGRPGVDLIVAGTGYLVMPPSITAERYVWTNLAPVARAPSWLIGIVRIGEAPRGRRPHPAPTTDVQVAGVLRFVASSVEGTRNASLFWGACRLMERQVPGAEALLIDAAGTCGLDESEARATIRSAVNRVVPGR